MSRRCKCGAPSDYETKAICRECAKIAMRVQRSARPGKYHAIDRAARAVWSGRYPKRSGAVDAVQIAVRKGQLVRRPCEVCGDPDAQAHHHDYDRPLDVSWRCQNHHKELHRTRGQLALGGGYVNG